MPRIYVNSQVKSKRKFEIVICRENISRFQPALLESSYVTDNDNDDDGGVVIMNMNRVNVKQCRLK